MTFGFMSLRDAPDHVRNWNHSVSGITAVARVMATVPEYEDVAGRNGNHGGIVKRAGRKQMNDIVGSAARQGLAPLLHGYGLAILGVGEVCDLLAFDRITVDVQRSLDELHLVSTNA